MAIRTAQKTLSLAVPPGDYQSSSKKERELMSNEYDGETELAALETKLAEAKKEVVIHCNDHKRMKATLTTIETQLITAKEEVLRAEEVVRLFRQHKLLTSIEDDLRETEIKRFRAAMPAAMAKIEKLDAAILSKKNAADAVIAQAEMDRFKKRVELMLNFSKSLAEKEEYIPETLQE